MTAKPKVTLKESPTPTEEIIDQSSKIFTVTDSKGVEISLKDPGILAQFRLVEIVGDKVAQNQTWMAMAMPMTYIYAINKEQVGFPANKIELEALIKRLGYEGHQALMTGIKDHFGSDELDIEAVKK